MAKQVLPRPTEAELAILRVLWSEGPCTVRKVQEVMVRRQPTGYTTVLKLLQIMTEKGLVLRDESERSHVYRASRAEAQTQKQLVGDLLERAFGGSALKLVMQALATTRTSTEELAEIRTLIERLERERGVSHESDQSLAGASPGGPIGMVPGPFGLGDRGGWDDCRHAAESPSQRECPGTLPRRLRLAAGDGGLAAGHSDMVLLFSGPMRRHRRLLDLFAPESVRP